MGRWTWPDWALDEREPQIEVFVEDPAQPKHGKLGHGQWVKACPQRRILEVDKGSGAALKDDFLGVNYEYGGVEYKQDFGPQHVRKIGNHFSVAQAFDRSTSGVDDSDWSEDED